MTLQKVFGMKPQAEINVKVSSGNNSRPEAVQGLSRCGPSETEKRLTKEYFPDTATAELAIAAPENEYYSLKLCRHTKNTFLFVVFGVYFAWFWARGQTLAMKTWGIRVVDRNGQALTQRRALLRYLCSWVWFLPPLAVLAPFKLRGPEIAVLWLGWVAVWALLSRFHPQRQFWHDALAGTRLQLIVHPVQQQCQRGQRNDVAYVSRA